MAKVKNQKLFIIIICPLLISIGIGLLFALNYISPDPSKEISNKPVKNTSLNKTESQPNNKKSDLENNKNDLNVLLKNQAQGNSDVSSEIQTYTSKNYQNNLLESKDNILEMLDQTNLDQKSSGYLFLPKHPAKYQPIANVDQIDIPLILQNQPDWQKTNYGIGDYDYLGDTGCAIVSLTMVHSALSNTDIQPQVILDWAQEHYFVAGSGTSWQIFSDFASQFQYQFNNYGNDFYSAMQAVQEGKVVVASVKPGFFTDVGHIIVIRGYDQGKVYVNDPNDDIEKMHSIQGIEEDIFLTEGVNYWSFDNDLGDMS